MDDHTLHDDTSLSAKSPLLDDVEALPLLSTTSGSLESRLMQAPKMKQANGRDEKRLEMMEFVTGRASSRDGSERETRGDPS